MQRDYQRLNEMLRNFQSMEQVHPLSLSPSLSISFSFSQIHSWTVASLQNNTRALIALRESDDRRQQAEQQLGEASMELERMSNEVHDLVRLTATKKKERSPSIFLMSEERFFLFFLFPENKFAARYGRQGGNRSG